MGERRGGKTRNFIDQRMKTRDGEPIPLKGDAFQTIWKHYDKDHSGFLEGKEIDSFLKDYLNSNIVGIGENVTNDEARQLRDMFVEEFDTNQDGKISMREVTHILPVEEAFFVMFRYDNQNESSHDYMAVWKKYDKDYSGYIEKDELRAFLRDVVQKSNPSQPVDEERLNEHADHIMRIYDKNQDGKLSLSELSRLLPPEENFVQKIIDKALSMNKLTPSDVDVIINHYDKDGNGTLEGRELENLAREILTVTQKDGYFNSSDVYDLKQALLQGCDLNGDGRIDRRELTLILVAIANDQHAEPEQQHHVHRVQGGRKANYILSYVPLDDKQNYNKNRHAEQHIEQNNGQ